MKFRLFTRRRDDLDARVADARERLRRAGEEAALSRSRREAVKDTVIRPLREASERNQFADMLRASLRHGYGKGT